MLTTVAAALIPLILMILAGAIAYRREILPENSATVLNGFTYYFTLPALLFYSMATTPFGEIVKMRFIAGYLAALLLTFLVTFLCSKTVFGGRFTEANIRAAAASIGNTAFLGLPIMLYLFKGSHQALVVTSLAIMLPTVLLMICVSVFEIDRAEKGAGRIPAIGKIVVSLLKTPMIFMAALGIIFSFVGLELPEFLAKGLKGFGMASVPCALFAVGILIAKLKVRVRIREMALVGVAKLLLCPLLAGLLLTALGVERQTVLMGVLLAGMPPAALVSVLAETYNVCEAETAASVVVWTFLYIPTLYFTLYAASLFGLHL